MNSLSSSSKILFFLLLSAERQSVLLHLLSGLRAEHGESVGRYIYVPNIKLFTNLLKLSFCSDVPIAQFRATPLGFCLLDKLFPLFQLEIPRGWGHLAQVHEQGYCCPGAQTNLIFSIVLYPVAQVAENLDWPTCILECGQRMDNS